VSRSKNFSVLIGPSLLTSSFLPSNKFFFYFSLKEPLPRFISPFLGKSAFFSPACKKTLFPGRAHLGFLPCNYSFRASLSLGPGRENGRTPSCSITFLQYALLCFLLHPLLPRPRPPFPIKLPAICDFFFFQASLLPLGKLLLPQRPNSPPLSKKNLPPSHQNLPLLKLPPFHPPYVGWKQ